MKIETFSLVIFLYLIGLVFAIPTDSLGKTNPKDGKPDSSPPTNDIPNNDIMNTIKNKLVDKNISPEILKEIFDTLAPLIRSSCSFPVGPVDPVDPVNPDDPEGPDDPDGSGGPDGLDSPEGPDGPDGPKSPKNTKSPKGSSSFGGLKSDPKEGNKDPKYSRGSRFSSVIDNPNAHIARGNDPTTSIGKAPLLQ